MPPKVVVVGCPSVDRILAPGTECRAVGGAAFITALAAHGVGATVGLVARIPRDLPREVASVFGPGGLHRGGLRFAPGSLPSHTIVYDQEHRATYVEVDGGMEAYLSPDDVPQSWLGPDTSIIHLGSLAGSAALQLSFARSLRERGFRGLLSAGTYRLMVENEPERVGELLLQTDLFFLNEEEARALIPEGPPRMHKGMVCITRGAAGVRVWGGSGPVDYEVPALNIVDATGAGDAFCGGFLGALARGYEPVPAAVAMAGEVLSDWGGEALRSLAASSVGPRAHMDAEAVRRLAPHLEAVAQSSALDFTGFPFPEEDDPAALECLAAATLHQYGFWRGTESGYGGAMYASAQNRRFKGSDFIWQAFTRASTVDPSVFEPERMATEGDLFEDLHRADDGSCPVPDIESHRVLHQAYGQDLLAQFPDGFQGAVVQANRSARPAQALLDILATLGGYREDPLAKKANLLVVLLAARPERFLRLDDPESIGPIVDYHVMRGCLRTGCVAIDDPQLRARLTARQWVDVVEEEAIRAATHEAVLALVEETGRSVAEIDGFLFSNGRKRCVEGVEPDCDACPVAEGCAKQVELFQPIYRTTFY